MSAADESGDLANGRLTREIAGKYRDLINDRFGIFYSPAKLYLLKAKLLKLSEKVGDLEEFYTSLVIGVPWAVDTLMGVITVGHTFFFREGEHFSILAEDIRARKLRSPLVWCAASSTGEEPYSIAITLLEAEMDDFLILCSDINPKAIGVMHRGVYGEGKFENTPRPLIRKYFDNTGPGEYRVKADLRRYLKIKKLNLFERLVFERKFDYIFCRNVMIYFDGEGRRKVFDNLLSNLSPGGLLFLGQSETIFDLPQNVRKEGVSMYRKTGEKP